MSLLVKAGITNLSELGIDVSKDWSVTPTHTPAWGLPAWEYRQKITINHTKVPNTDQSDFPVLITGANIKDAFWGHVKADGSDVAVTSSDGVTKLKRELVSIDTAGKTIVLWVKADLSHTIDTELYLYYGNAAASESNDPDTWDTHFKMVQHSNDKPDTSHITGSTSLARVGTKTAAGEPVVATGKVGQAQDYDGDNDYIDFGNVLAFERDDPFEFSFIVKPNIGAARRFLFGKMNFEAPYRGYFLRIEADSTLRVFLCHDFAADKLIQLTSVGTMPDGSYTFVTITYDGSSTAAGLKIYFKLVLDVPAVDKDGLTDTLVDTEPFRLGIVKGGTDYLKGILDEFWASDMVRAADWRETRINNQDSPAIFYSVANEEAKVIYYLIKNLGAAVDDNDLVRKAQAILERVLTAKGDIFYRGEAEAERLAPGTSGRFLKCQGVGRAPIWGSY